jgi:lipoprotein-anchoring transpeptidase ErfK/SrfK
LSLLLLAAVEVVAAIVIDLSEQRLRAFDAGGAPIYAALVSTGLPASPTPTGRFVIGSKYAATSLVGDDYRTPVVPHVMCLAGGGLRPDAVCLHPAPWQDAARQCYGVRRSHGCIRTSQATARWLFERTALGTPVVIQE